MRMRWVVLFGYALTGCAFFVSPSQSAVDRGREIYPKCKMSAEAAISPLFSKEGIDSVEPAYMNRPGTERRLRGVRIVAKPVPGWSPESLARSLECHEARIALGHVAALPDEPFTLPVHWISVDVESDGNAFAIILHTPDFDDAKELTLRARRFYSGIDAKN